MLFNSYPFILIFLPCVIAGYYFIRQKMPQKWALSWLCLASFCFYGWWKPEYLWILLFSVFFNYKLGRRLATAHRSKAALVFGIAVNLCFLGYYKYTNFLMDNINQAFNTDYHIGQIILPLGISFFTLQQIAFLVDSYSNKTKEYSFFQYSLFVTFFPQLVAGPIVHHSEMMPQFKEKISGKSLNNLIVGLSIFSIGLFKKVMIADTVSAFATPVFMAADNGYAPSFFEAWTCAVAYSLQVYFDFSGYSDMAIGSGRMFGIRLPLNFNSPYKACGVIDFWRRWHMTLSRFLRDYLYIPFGGNRRGNLRRYTNIMLVMLIAGLWHGPSWNFVIWGGLHGCFMLYNHFWRFIRSLANIQNVLWLSVEKSVAKILTLTAVIAAWVFFRAETLDGALRVMEGMLGSNGVIIPEKYLPRWGELSHALSQYGIIFTDTKYLLSLTPTMNLLLLLIASATFLPNTQEIMARHWPALQVAETNKKCWWQFEIHPLSAVCAAFLFITSFVHLTQITEFLYFNF